MMSRRNGISIKSSEAKILQREAKWKQVFTTHQDQDQQGASFGTVC